MEGAHPKVLQKLIETNEVSTPGYGNDAFTAAAKDKVRLACGCPDADVYFLVGGTQTNATVIDALLARHEGVIAAESGHINVHESGAIEASGHKVLAIAGHDGKLRACDVKGYLEAFYADGTYEHMVFPGMVYISHPTEYGTLYTKSELTELSAVCREYSIPLFLDGARLGYGLMSYETDVTLADIVELCDVFYIGGTKVGALCGEAVVFTKKNTPKHFFTIIKQNGALMAKGRVLGVQFDTQFTDGLYFDISRNAIDMARKLKELFVSKGYTMFVDSPTNQQFVVVDNEKLEYLKSRVGFDFWEKIDESRSVVRFATSWATTEEDLSELDSII
jgi:threonine aldolase